MITPLRLPVRPWFQDHCFDGRIILPAVEAMGLLAAKVKAAYPALETGVLRDARFMKFLEIAPDAEAIDVGIELQTLADGRVQAGLLTRKQMKAVARWTQHCTMLFGGAPVPAPSPWPEADSPPLLEAPCVKVYQELVPFGPAYRTLQGRVVLGRDWARATVLAPALPLDNPGLGSPFCLDGAMHAACVHGQRLVDFVPFPVDFAMRTIALPTLPGEEYAVAVRLRSVDPGYLVYDLLLQDKAGRVRETVLGLRMQDVSAGRIRPPAWIRAGQPDLR
jgi:hypothetical protein